MSFSSSSGNSVNRSSVLSSKWHQPGWRIEQRYSPGVLIGNWSEDRYKFERGKELSNSTHREAFRPYDPTIYAPDVTVRRKGLLRSCGLGKDQFFTHHGTRYMRNTISLYDQTFNRRYSLGPRNWDGKRMMWLPEASDHPLQGESTNFGLKQAIEEKWRKQRELESHGDFATNTSVSYKTPPEHSYELKRAAVSKDISCRAHPHSINKDLHLRNMYQTLFKETVDPRLLNSQ